MASLVYILILIDLFLLKKKKEEKEKGNFPPCLTLQSSTAGILLVVGWLLVGFPDIDSGGFVLLNLSIYAI